MSVTTTITSLNAVLSTFPNPWYPTWGAQFVNPKTRVTSKINEEDFPTAMIGYDTGQTHDFQLHMGDVNNQIDFHHRYHLVLFLLVGGKQTEIGLLQQRIEPFPALLIPVLANWLIANGESLSMEEAVAFPYRIGLNKITESDSYWGMRMSLYLNENG